MKTRKKMERMHDMSSIAPIRKKTLSDAVKESLRKLISDQAFHEAGKLPPEEELARQLAVSRITIRKALTDLEQEGLLLRLHGRGTFVNPAARQVKVNLSSMLEFGSVISGNGYRPECRLVSVEEERIPAAYGEQLGAGKEGRGIRVEKLYMADGVPAIVSIGRVPLRLFSQVPGRTAWQERSNFEVIQEYTGRMVVRDWVEISSLSEKEAEDMLGHPCPLNTASVLMIQAVGYDRNSEPVIHGVALYDTNHIRFNLLRHAEG